MPYSGQPMGDNLLEASVTAEAVAESRPPEAGSSDAGLHIPRYQGRGDLKVRVGRDTAVGIVYERGLETGSRALARHTPPPEGDTSGAGVSLQHSVASSSSEMRVGLAAEVMLYAIPYAEYAACDINCPVPYVVRDHGISIKPVASFAVVPSYRVHPDISLFGGLSLRNHPTIERTGVEVGETLDEDDVSAGSFHFIAAAGIEYAHASGARATLVLDQPLTADPVRYYPAVSVMLSIPLVKQSPAPGL